MAVLILPKQEHGISFYLCHLQFLSSVTWFSENMSFDSLAGLIPRYFIIFDVMVKGSVSLISPFDLSLLVHRNETDFWVLILYSTLTKSLMSSSSFLIKSLDFLCLVSYLQRVIVLLIF